ncbi:MAG: hypothetical protein ACD_43C00072G0001 [uncultured bacterium]|nr:MAG: hypothetical protein ACD_43C00072G0001 [uncultured bacterium]
MDETQFNNPYFKKPSQKDRLMKSDVWAYLGSLILVIVLLTWLTINRHWLWIENIDVTGNSYLTADQITTAANTALDQRHWWFMPQRVLPFTNEDSIGQTMRTELEKSVSLQSIEVTTDFPNTVHVTIKEYVPGYVYIEGKKYYYIDRSGIVTTEVNENELNVQYPHLRDQNKKRSVKLHDQVVGADVITFIDAILEQFTAKTGLNVSEFAIPAVTCQTKEYVAEKIFADEIEGTADNSIKEKKRNILNRLQKKEITVDESLALLEEVKRTEKGDNTNSTDANQAYVQWEAQYVDTPCDYVAVTHDIIVITNNQTEILFDSSLPIETQLQNFIAVFQDDLNNSVDGIKTIDVRYEDRVYYK